MNSQQQHPFQPKQQQKAAPKPFVPHDNVIETLRDVGSGITQSVSSDLISKTASTALDSLFGNPPRSGEYGKNPFEFPFRQQKKETPEQTKNRELLSPQNISKEQAQVRQQIEAIRQELAMLAKELGTLNQEVQKAIHEVPVDPGTYHLNFFERLRATIILLRKSVRDSSTWLNLSNSKKKQKGYWGMYKKHGTKFGLSSDRTPATQTG